jgi:hypothetical protein
MTIHQSHHDPRVLWEGDRIICTADDERDAQRICEALKMMQHISEGGGGHSTVAVELHRDIMNLPAESEGYAYRIGHRDARHAAAELVLERLGAAPACLVGAEKGREAQA